MHNGVLLYHDKVAVFCIFSVYNLSKNGCCFWIWLGFFDSAAILCLQNCIYVCIILSLSFWNPFQRK